MAAGSGAHSPLPAVVPIFMKFPKKIVYIGGGCLIAAFLLGNGGFRTMLRRYWEINHMQAELGSLKKENALLQKEVYVLQQDTTYIERMARKELGLVSQGEVEYRFNSEKKDKKDSAK